MVVRRAVHRRELPSAVAAALSGLALQPARLPPAHAATTRALRLADGSSLPLCSFGTQIYDDETAFRLTRNALEAGVRSFYASIESGNQRGFARAIRESAIPRDQLFIAGSVVTDNAPGFRAAARETRRGVEANADNLGSAVGALDMMLLEYPGSDTASIRGQWRALEEARSAGVVQGLGVSNFSPSQLDCILTDPRASSAPLLNQLPLSLAFRFPYAQLWEEHRRRGVALQVRLACRPGSPGASCTRDWSRSMTGAGVCVPATAAHRRLRAPSAGVESAGRTAAAFPAERRRRVRCHRPSRREDAAAGRSALAAAARLRVRSALSHSGAPGRRPLRVRL